MFLPGTCGCCCPPCVEDCEELTVTVSYCDIDVTVTCPAPGQSQSVQVTDGDNYIIAQASISCDCGEWCVIVSLCIVCNGLFYGDQFSGCVTQGATCPVGEIPLECLSEELFNIPCVATVTATLS